MEWSTKSKVIVAVSVVGTLAIGLWATGAKPARGKPGDAPPRPVPTAPADPAPAARTESVTDRAIADHFSDPDKAQFALYEKSPCPRRPERDLSRVRLKLEKLRTNALDLSFESAADMCAALTVFARGAELLPETEQRLQAAIDKLAKFVEPVLVEVVNQSRHEVTLPIDRRVAAGSRGAVRLVHDVCAAGTGDSIRIAFPGAPDGTVTLRFCQTDAEGRDAATFAISPPSAPGIRWERLAAPGVYPGHHAYRLTLRDGK